MTNRRLKKPVVYALYISSIIFVLGAIYLIEGTISNNNLSTHEEKPIYVVETILEEEIPVVGEDAKIIKPYTDSEIKIVRNFYDYEADNNSQVSSIIYHENTYMQSSGVSYGGKENFDIVSILDGTVANIKEDLLLGNIVEITHGNDMISIYQSLSEVNVKKGDEVKQGSIIGKSGTCNIAKDLGNHLDFELIVKGQTVNPESYYDKSVSEI